VYARVAQNLDPLSRHADEEIWRALDLVSMKSAVEAKPDKLNTTVADGGVVVGSRACHCIPCY
jgi:ABC-type multidrug transport system fused ATPase/permease subunit